MIRIEDQGEGFVPEEVADPLAPENILKSSGRGIFLIRNFMDETVLKKVPGGMEIRMVKKLQKTGVIPTSAKATAGKADPRFLATAIEAVVRAGDIQIAKFGTGVRVEKKGAIDLVTEVDLEVERMFRAMVAERFPDHDVLAEELGGASRGARHRWVFDPLDGTTNFAHGVPIFCASLALEIDGEAVVAAVYDPNREELFTAEAGVGSWLNGERLKVSANATVLESMLVTGFPYNIHQKADEFLAGVRPGAQAGARDSPPRLGGDRHLLGRGGADGRVLGGQPEAVGHARRGADPRRGRRQGHRHGRQARGSRTTATSSPPTDSIHDEVLQV